MGGSMKVHAWLAVAAWQSLALLVVTASAAVVPRGPAEILGAAADRIYAAGETSGRVTEMIAAEMSAADEMRRYVASGSIEGLLATDSSQQSALQTAAYLGYPDVVAALLTSPLVKAHINDTNATGLSAWIAATMSMRRSLWTCNPTVFNDPYRFVPLLVTQPYYTSNPVPPYARTRELLEQSGARPDASKAKELWLTVCKAASENSRSTVQNGADLQTTVQALGAVDLAAQVTKLRKSAADAGAKP
jgi:hypothetical protein